MGKRIQSKLTFWNGSKKYFLSSLIIPAEKHADLTAIYNFCRLVDDSVDLAQSASLTFNEIVMTFHKQVESANTNGKNPIINEFVKVFIEKELEIDWVEALFTSMEMDLTRYTYRTLEDTFKYCYGVAEVVGLMVAKTYDVDASAYEFARYAGRAAQWANFIRDINGDLKLGRKYFPEELLDSYGLSLEEADSVENIGKFSEFIINEISRYEGFIKFSKKGYKSLPSYLEKSLKVSNVLDQLVLNRIKNEPLLVYKMQVKPRKRDILRALGSYSFN